MNPWIEDADVPSLLELRERVAAACGRGSAAEGDAGELTGGERNVYCEALFYLAYGARGRLHYLTGIWPPAQWDAVEAWLDDLAEMVPGEIAAVRRHTDAWVERFWASGGQPAQWDAFRQAVAGTVMEGFAIQTRQHLLARYGETS
jgi:hypothetical protein